MPMSRELSEFLCIRQHVAFSHSRIDWQTIWPVLEGAVKHGDVLQHEFIRVMSASFHHWSQHSEQHEARVRRLYRGEMGP